MTEVQDYNVDVIYCGGDPVLFIMNKEGEEVEEIPLEDYSETQIAQLLEEKGFDRFKPMQ